VRGYYIYLGKMENEIASQADVMLLHLRYFLILLSSISLFVVANWGNVQTQKSDISMSMALIMI
jgi:hypothetical protein